MPVTSSSASHASRGDDNPAWLFVKRLFATRFGGLGASILIFVTVVSLSAPLLANFGATDLASTSLAPPSSEHPMGTDSIGRDIWSVLLFGGRTSLSVALVAAAMAVLIGGTLGAIAGYYRGTVAAVILRITDLFHTLPVIILVLFTVSLVGASFWLLIAAVALAIWPIEARLVYSQFIVLSEREYVLAARSAGMPTWHIIFKEILPNVFPTVVVQVSLDASAAILIEAGLGFLGLSDPAVSSWGEMLNRGQQYLEIAWWMSVFPGAAICLTVLGFNLLADGLSEVFNPRVKTKTSQLSSMK